MKNKILIAILVVVVIGGITWNISRENLADTTDNLVQQPQATRVTDDKTGELKTYRNKEVGISFQYPDIFNRVDMQIINGDTGRLFAGVLEFAPNHWISFGGATKDYTASKGGTLIDTHGYEKQGEKYAIKFVWGSQEVTSSEFWPMNGGKDKAIVVRNTQIGQVLSREGVAAFVNIPNSSFPGFVFDISPSSPGQTLDEKEIDILRQVVSSITFE